MARTNHYSDVDTWRLADTFARFCIGTFNIHPLLGVAHVYLGNFVFYKEQQEKALKENYEERYELD